MLINSMDDLSSNSQILHPPARNTVALTSELAKLRENRKRNKERISDLTQQREEDLFGDLEQYQDEIMRNTVGPKPKRLVQNQSFHDVEVHNDEIFTPAKDLQDEQESETEYDTNINELEGNTRATIPGNIGRYESKTFGDGLKEEGGKK